MIGAVCGSVYKWRCTQNRQMGSAEKTYEFEMKMLQGRWLDHIIDMWSHLHNHGSVKAVVLLRHLTPDFLKPSVHGGEIVYWKISFSFIVHL